MARDRLTKSAKADIGSLLRTSAAVPGRDARTRYEALLLAALRRVAGDPDGLSTLARQDLRPGLRRFHIRHSRSESREAPVGDPAHMIFYRAVGPGLVEIVRVLHERMEPSRHVCRSARHRREPQRGQ